MAPSSALPARDAGVRSRPSSQPWRWPWYVTALGLGLPIVPFVAYSLVYTYLLRGRWENVLPGLGDSLPRRFSMGAHMHLGAVAMLLGPLQFIGPLRRRWPKVHRWIGRFIATSMLLCFLAGMTFIVLKGKLVGGYNMTVAFAAGGLWFGLTTAMTWYTAWRKQFDHHWAWAVRCYAMCLSPFLYRYWYYAAGILGYSFVTPYRAGKGEVCHAVASDITCPRYYRPFDALHAWTYWLLSALIAELIIAGLRRSDQPLFRRATEVASSGNSTCSSTINDGLGDSSGKRLDVSAPSFGRVITDSDTQKRRRQARARWAVNALGAALGIVVCTVTSIGVIEVAMSTERIRVMLG